MFKNYPNEITDIRCQLIKCQRKLETENDVLYRLFKQLERADHLIQQLESDQTKKLTQIKKRKNFINKTNNFFEPSPPDNIVRSCQEVQSVLENLRKKIAHIDEEIKELDLFKEQTETNINIAQQNIVRLSAEVDRLQQKLSDISIEDNPEAPVVYAH